MREVQYTPTECPYCGSIRTPIRATRRSGAIVIRYHNCEGCAPDDPTALVFRSRHYESKRRSSKIKREP